MNPFLLVAIKLLIGFLALVLIINITGKGNLAPSSASDQVVNYVLGGIVGGVIYNNSIKIHEFVAILGIWCLLVLCQKWVKNHNVKAKQLIDGKAHIIIDDGGDLVHLLHTTRKDAQERLIGGTEETTTGVIRLRGLEKEGTLQFPMIAANDSYCKYLFDNRYGTGQSTWDGIMRTTNLTVVGKRVVIAGYGWCGRGCAMRAKGLGAHVIVTEVDPIKAIEAVFDGFEVMPMEKAAEKGDIFVTLTGDKDVITRKDMEKMKDGVLLANAGHFDVEINKNDLNDLAVRHFEGRHNIESYELSDGRIINLLAEGRLVNLAAGDGHPAEIMDLSFAVQALAAEYLLHKGKSLENRVYVLPKETDMAVASVKLHSMGYEIDTLSKEQRTYLNLD